ncbi:MAG: hypothetical protein NWE83_07420 [Candidatus Bathyarchaeota archaeon]|nr:hypothetical protein [Candidatus Bathyarchaeota archaeon]
MALLPNTIIYGTTGNNSAPTEKPDGGTVIGITSASDTTNGPITQTFNLTDNAIDGETRRVVVLEASGTAHAYSAQRADTGGTFAYEQDQFIIRNVTTEINGQSNTVLQINGIPRDRPKTLISNSAKGALLSTAHRLGYWQGVGISAQRTNWSTAPSTGSITFKLPTNNATDADDQGQFVTYKSVPGELAYMYGAIDPLQDEYKARMGA